MSTRLYSYVLLTVAVAAAVVRFRRDFRSAELQSLRLDNATARRTQMLLAVTVLAGASALTVFSVLHLGMSWLWVAAVVAWLSGLQAILTLLFGAPQQLLVMERIFGILFGGVAILIYMMFVR